MKEDAPNRKGTMPIDLHHNTVRAIVREEIVDMRPGTRLSDFISGMVKLREDYNFQAVSLRELARRINANFLRRGYILGLDEDKFASRNRKTGTGSGTVGEVQLAVKRRIKEVNGGNQ